MSVPLRRCRDCSIVVENIWQLCHSTYAFLLAAGWLAYFLWVLFRLVKFEFRWIHSLIRSRPDPKFLDVILMDAIGYTRHRKSLWVASVSIFTSGQCSDLDAINVWKKNLTSLVHATWRWQQGSRSSGKRHPFGWMKKLRYENNLCVRQLYAEIAHSCFTFQPSCV